MKTRKELEDEILGGVWCRDPHIILMEVLLDIRDLLVAEEESKRK